MRGEDVALAVEEAAERGGDGARSRSRSAAARAGSASGPGARRSTGGIAQRCCGRRAVTDGAVLPNSDGALAAGCPGPARRRGTVARTLGPVTATVRELLAAERPRGRSSSSRRRRPRREAQLWTALRELERLRPSFVSVTYGAGGSTREGTVSVTERIATETTMTPLAHLTAVDHSVAELRHVVSRLAAAGVRNLLALRGDPPGADPQAEWVAHPRGAAATPPSWSS